MNLRMKKHLKKHIVLKVKRAIALTCAAGLCVTLVPAQAWASEPPAHTGTEFESQTETEFESQTETEYESQTETEFESQTETEFESETESESEPESETETETETESETGTESEAESETETETETESETETGSEIAPMMMSAPVMQRENSWRFENGVWNGAYDMSGYAVTDFRPWSKIDGYYVNGSGYIIENAVKRGIDVSEWQGRINWEAVKKDDVSFAILRCGAGISYDDKQWEYNRAECERLGIPYGTYLYSYAQSAEDAVKEAEHVLSLIAGANLSYPIYYDLEDNTISALGNDKIAEIARVFCDTIEAAGYDVQIYSNLYWLSTFLTDPYFQRFGAGKWVAQYYDQCTYEGAYNIWQATSNGRIKGIDTNVDINFIMDPSVSRPQLAGKEANINSEWYYFDQNGRLAKGWVKHHGNQYYYGTLNADMKKHIQKIDGKSYGFNEWTGVLLKGEHYFTDGSDDHWYYFDGKTGVMQTGWVKHHGNQYYYNAAGQMMYDEQKIGGHWYYFNEWTGVMATGWTTHHNEWYYYNEKGHRTHGEVLMDDHWYYFDEKTGVTANKGFTYHHNHWYYYNDYGYMQYGEKYIDGDWYYFDPYLGIMATGWTTHHGNRYYYDEKGRMYHGRHEINGKIYEFDEVTGVLKD